MIVTTNGVGIYKDSQTLGYLRQAARRCGVIILTDSDAAGFQIRNYLANAIGEGQVLHAYIPDIYGTERRKAAPGREGKLGVEGMTPEILLQALRRGGATFVGEAAPSAAVPITKADLLDRGLIGPGSTQKRQQLLKNLELPEHLTPNALLETLNLLMSREEFYEQ